MVALIGTATGTATMLQDFVRLQHEMIAACRTTLELVTGAAEREAVATLSDDCERHMAEFRRLATVHDVCLTDAGTPHEARTIGSIRLAHRRGGDGAALEVLAGALAEARAAYDRALRNAALTETTRPLFKRAVRAVRRHHLGLDEVARAA